MTNTSHSTQRNLFKGLAIGLIILFALGFLISFSYEQIARATLENISSRALGTNVEIGSLDISPFSGHASLTNLHIKNPTGYGEQSILEIPYIHTALNVKSIFSQKVLIHFIQVNGVNINYMLNEKGQSNLQTLLQTISQKESSTDSSKNQTASDSSKRVIIQSLEVNDINLKASIADKDIGKVSVKALKMKNIGENKKMTTREVIQMVLSTVASTSIKSVSGLSFQSGMDKILEGTGDIGRGLKSLFD